MDLARGNLASGPHRLRIGGSARLRASGIRHARYLQRSFTLLEMIVVIIVLSILVMLIVPRLTGNPAREFRLAVDRVGDLLTMYGQRQDLGQKIVAISHNRDQNTIALLEIDSSDSVSGASNWRLDPYVKPVHLPSFMTDTDIEFFVDGDPYDASDWPLASEPGQERPTIEIHLRGADETAALILQPQGVSPIIINGENSSGINRAPVDLDAEGRSREDW
jgi:prepilin-type N-terminal cleavage/methylation domain-containing protein